MVSGRQVLNQGEIAVYGPQNVTASQTSTALKFSVSTGQAWRVQELDIEAPPNCTIALKYGEELSGDDLQMGTFYAYEFPMKFKPTASDNHLVLMEERDLTFQVYNTYAMQITCRAVVRFIKTYLEARR